MHFVARCNKYPSFRFNVPALRPLLDKRGRKFDAENVAFQDRILDTKAAGFTEPEAKEIYTALEKMQSYPPIFGAHITVLQGGPKE